MAVTIEIRDSQIGDRICLPRTQARPVLRSAVNDHPIITHDTENISFAVAVKIAKTKVGNAVCGEREVREHSDAAV